jgi:Uma2 family endonuclease
MSIAESPKPMTAEEFMALPDDGRERWLVDGQVYYPEDAMTVRNWLHSETLITIGTLLKNWLVTQPRPRGKLVGGEAGILIRRDPDQMVGTDIAYLSPGLAASMSEAQAYVDGPPVLAIEILSPSDKIKDILSKTETYLSVGAVVWVVDPYSRIITVHQPGQRPKPYAPGDELAADPYLPGFCVAVADFFED